MSKAWWVRGGPGSLPGWMKYLPRRYHVGAAAAIVAVGFACGQPSLALVALAGMALGWFWGVLYIILVRSIAEGRRRRHGR